MTRVVMVRGRSIPRNRPYMLAALSLLMGVLAGINLGIGVNMYCHNDYYCDYRRRAYIISGSCFVVSSVCFMISAIAAHLRIKKAIAMQQSRPDQQTVTVTAEYPTQPVVSFPVVQTQYPPPYMPPTGPTPYMPPTGPTPYMPPTGQTPYPQSTGPTPYPLPPTDNQHQPQIGFAVASEPTQGTNPPPYAP